MKLKSQIFRKIVFILFIIFIYGCQTDNNETKSIINSNSEVLEDLTKGFQNPSLSAKPRVFWWWLNSMATKESITRDLEELKDKGFGGAMIFDAGSSSYRVAYKTKPGPVFGSPEWKELFACALKEADRLGLELSLNIQSGWNPGGPTVTPKDAMKKIVWTEKQIGGPAKFVGTLPKAKGEFYHDIALQAYRLLDNNKHRPINHWGHQSLNKQFSGGGAYPFHILRQQEMEDEKEIDLKSTALINLTGCMDGNDYLQ